MTTRTLCVLVGRAGRPPEELSVTYTAGHRVSDLTAALAAHLSESGQLHLHGADGELLEPGAPIQDTAVRHGDHLVLVAGGEAPAAAPALELRVRSGAAAGQRLPLPDGRRSLGRGQDCDLRILDPSVSRSPAWIVVEGRSVVLERVEGRQAIRSQGRPLAPPCPLPAGELLEMGEALLTIAEAPAPRPPGRRGSLPLVRPARATPAYRPPSLLLPTTPQTPGGPPLPGWAARWRERRRVARYRRRAAPVTGRIPALLAEELRARREMAPDAAVLADRAHLGAAPLWEHRPGDPDFLRLALGRGDVPSWIGFERPAGADGALIDAALHDLLPGPEALRGAPVSLDLAALRVLAVTGTTEAAGLARWLVLQAACLHAPGDLRIAAALVSAEGWDWLQWLPHAAPAGVESARRLLGTGDDAERLLAAIAATVAEPRAAGATLLAIVDDACPGVDRLVDAVLRAPDAGVVLLVLGANEAAPAAVGVVPARNELRLSVRGDGRIQTGVPDQVSPDVAARVARELAAIDDGSVPAAPGLLDVAATAPSPAGELRERWAADAGQLDAVLGAGPDGGVELDVASGPHALVAGGTRAARGSLLCSWVAALALRHSPRWLNVLLLDPAGGAPWHDLAGLPHVAAAPPETDGAIADVVAALLREAERRRQLLAEAGARDVAQLRRARPDEAPANLLVAVDGYDLLAARRPDVEDRLARLVDLSAGLGVHVVLGTGIGNRPLPGPIRRHAGIRIDLDAGDRADETVIGIPAGAGAAPAAGTARVTIAEGVSTGFRPPDVGHRSAGEDGAVQVRRLRFGGDGARLGAGADLTALVDAARAAARDLPGVEDRVWRPLPGRLAARRDGAAPAAAAARAELRLTIASPPQPARDVAVEMGLERTFGDLVAALVAQLGLAVTSSVTVYHPRRRVWLRPDQTIRSTRLRAGDVLVVAPRSFDVEAAFPAPPDAIDDGRVDDQGRIAVNRPPRPSPSEPDLRVPLAAPPERGQGGWRALMPVGTGVLMGVMLGVSTYAISGPGRSADVVLLSAGMTPLMALLTGILPLRDAMKRRGEFRRAARRWRERLEGLEPAVEAARALETTFLLDGAPDAGALLERARTLDPALWERRPGSPDWLRLRLGEEDVPSRVTVDFPGGGDAALRARAERRIAATGATLTVPMALPLAESGSAGLYGDRGGVGALARSLVAQVALLHSPGEVMLAAAVPASEQRRWAWLGWLPHVHAQPTVLPGPRVASGAAARDLLQRLLALVDARAQASAPLSRRTAVVALLHEDAELPRGEVGRLLEQGSRSGVHVVWLASRREDLPGEVGAEVGIRPVSGVLRPELRPVASGRARTGGAAEGMSVEACLEVARALAPLADFRATVAGGAPPERLDLLDLLGLRDDVDAGVRRRWASRRAGDRPLTVPIGAGPGGAEVALDLVAEGPHLLVEGGARSGKSELLRTVVASLAVVQPPSSVALLLVDHGGQGTFPQLAGLPQVTSVESFIDVEGSRRLLGALQAELGRREAALREAGAKDLTALGQARPESAPPRLVVVLDEFGGLATELPDLMSGILALAPHGARVGIHLVLATGQASGAGRPVRDAVALQLQLRGDGPAGRALVRAGGEAEREVQVALAGGTGAAQRDPAEIVVRDLDFSGTPLAAAGREGPASPGQEADLTRVVKAVRSAATRLDELPQAVLPELTADAADVGATSVPLPELLGIPDVAALDVDTLWRPQPLAARLRVPTGMTDRGVPMVMDLKEAAVGGAGPHGLIIGTSGSGKSEMLRTLVTALAITHSPEILAFVFIDFKGGAAFAGLSELPHVAGMITNLQDDLSLIDRMQAAITGERNRRQELLRRAGNVDKLSEYQRKRESGEPLEPLPYLMLVVDEFGELLTARPDFVNLFAMVGRVGRSLGIHLLFSSQQFEEGRLRGLEDNLGYRIALRTASPLASRTVLGAPDAFDLPKEPGWGYYKYGPTDMVRFRAALVSSGAPSTLDLAVAQLRDRGEPTHQIWLPPLEVGITLDRLLGEIAETPDRGLTATARPGAGQLHVPAGLVDRPAEQKQDVMSVDLTGHLLVVGAAQTGKSTMLRTLIAGAALTHTPREAQFYCVDYGGGALRTLADLPHVGSVSGRGEVERVRRTVEEIVALVASREAGFQALGLDSPQVMRARRAAGELDDVPDVFLVVDNWAGLRQELPDLEEPIRDVIAARGPGYGVHLVLTASRWTEVRDALRNAIGGRLELRLTEPAESVVEVRAARNLSESAGQYEKRVEELRQLTGTGPKFEKLFGRGILRGGLQFQTALPRIDGVPDILDLQEGVERLVRGVAVAWGGPAAPPIRVLPPSIRLAELPAPGPDEPGVPIGLSERDLGPVLLDLVGGDPHFLVFGDVESGKTTLLRTFLTGLVARTGPDQAQILIVDYRRGLTGLVPPEQLLAHCASEAAVKENVGYLVGSLQRRLPGPDVPADQQHGRSWWKSQAEVYVVVDDYDLVTSSSSGPLQPLYALLPQSRDVALHLVVARSSGGAGQGILEAALRRLRDLRSPGLLLSGEPQEGAILGGVRMSPLPPGRGRLIRRREGPTFVQVAQP